MKSRIWRRQALLASAMVMALAGCSGDDDGGDGDSSEATDPPSTSAAPGTVSPPDLPEAPQLRKAKGGVADVEWDAAACPTEAGEQTVEGTVTNSTKGETTYVVTLSWTNDSYDVLGRGIAVLEDAPPGEATTWEVDAEVVEGATSCVINVQRGELKKQN